MWYRNSQIFHHTMKWLKIKNFALVLIPVRGIISVSFLIHISSVASGPCFYSSHCNVDTCADVCNVIKSTVHILYCRNSGEVSLTVKHIGSVLTNSVSVQIRTIKSFEFSSCFAASLSPFVGTVGLSRWEDNLINGEFAKPCWVLSWTVAFPCPVGWLKMPFPSYPLGKIKIRNCIFSLLAVMVEALKYCHIKCCIIAYPCINHKYSMTLEI